MKYNFRKYACLLLAMILLACGVSCATEPPASESTAPQTSDEITVCDDPTEAPTADKRLYYVHDPGAMMLTSPYNTTGQNRVSLPRINGSVDEAVSAGADVFITEIYGNVASYPSKVYSPQEHYRWFTETFGKSITTGFPLYAYQGGDYVKSFCDRTHAKGADYWLSYRLNDHHDMTRPVTQQNANPKNICKFYMEHQNMLIGEPQSNCSWFQYMMDFRHEEVREYKLAMICELIENYEIEGFMIDFLRTPALFKLSATTEAQRKEIMLDFMKTVGQALKDKSKVTGKDYTFAVKLPMDKDAYGKLGIDVKAFEQEAGVNAFFVFDYFCARQDYEMLDEIRALCPNSEVVLEIAQATTWTSLPEMPRAMRLTTKEQYYTTAHVAYEHGADGVSLFNFPWYRSEAENGAYYEPPFEIFPYLKSSSYLASQPQHYFEGATENKLIHDFDLKTAEWNYGERHSFFMEMSAPTGGWSEDGVLRLESLSALKDLNVEVYLNGVKLSAVDDRGEPYENPYQNLLGTEEGTLSYAVPKEYLNNGSNEITVVNLSARSFRLFFVDVAIA
ncbi:MAG: hypothetical protein E7620_09150 [Ruminococcaceae bacterium]|nr:hypothetical protein [Oscillospiraceae bacterium]